jgi:hypothetical protein
MIESADDSKKILAAMKLKGVTYQKIRFNLAAMYNSKPYSINYIKQIINGELKNSKAIEHKYNIMKYLGLID